MTGDSDRFWSKVDRSGGPDACWSWNGYRMASGYGKVWIGSRTNGTQRRVLAHRFAYELTVGPIPAGRQLDHLCHGRDRDCFDGSLCAHRACCNPAHMEPVTSAQNVQRGRSWAINGLKTHCPAGHAYDEENTYFYPDGRRACRTCVAAAQRRYQKRKELAIA